MKRSLKVSFAGFLRKVPFFLAGVVLAAGFLSCDEFFSDSMGSARTYSASSVKVNASNVNQWVERAVGDPSLASTVAAKIISELKNGSLSARDKFALSEAGLKLSVESSGLGESVLTHATGSLSELLDDNKKADSETTDKLKDILGQVQRDFNSSGGKGAANNASTILELNQAKKYSEYKNGDVPKMDSYFRENAQPGDVAETVMVLIMGELGDTNIADIDEDDEDAWKDIEKLATGLSINDSGSIPEVVVDTKKGQSPSNDAIALAACLNLIVSDDSGKLKDDPITGAIYDAFMKR